MANKMDNIWKMEWNMGVYKGRRNNYQEPENDPKII